MIRRFLVATLATLTLAACSLFGSTSGPSSVTVFTGAYTALTEVRVQTLKLLEAGAITADQAELANHRADELRRVLDALAERAATVPDASEDAQAATRRAVSGAMTLEACTDGPPAEFSPCVEGVQP